MKEDKFDDGVAEYTMGNGRVVVKMNDKTFACFENNKDGTVNEVASEVKNIMMHHGQERISLGFYENEKDGKIYRNITKISLLKEEEEPRPQEEVVKTDEQRKADLLTSKPKIINYNDGAFFGMCCNQALSVVLKQKDVVNWNDYKIEVRKFFKENKELREELL